MRGYRDSGTKYLDWTVGELTKLYKAFDVKEKNGNLFYRKIRSDHRSEITDKEVSEAIRVLAKKLVGGEEMIVEYRLNKRGCILFAAIGLVAVGSVAWLLDKLPLDI
jgi:hypothetical protein